MLMSISTEDLFAMARILVKNSKTPLDCIACANLKLGHNGLKFRYSEKATKFCEISTLDLTAYVYNIEMG